MAPLLDAQRELLCDSRDYEPGSENILSALLAGQDVIVDTLAGRYDALDTAVRESEIPFAEIDHRGRIVYANKALAEHILQPDGKDFASLFGARAQHVSEALRRKENVSLRVELERDGLPRQFRAEIGPLRDEDGELGAYALLLHLRAEELRLDAALDGIMRIDLTGKIIFANSKAQELLGVRREKLLGTRADRWLRGGPVDDGRDRIAAWLSATAAITEDAELATAGLGSPRPVRVSVVPFYDGPDGQSGILITFRSIAEDIARQNLRALLVVERDPHAVIHESMRIVRGLIPCDLAIFGVYTDQTRHYRALLLEPEPKWYWATRWFDVDPKVVEWLSRPVTWDNDVTAFVAAYAPDHQDDPVVLAIQRDGLSSMVVLPIQGPGGAFRSTLTLLAKERCYGIEDMRVLRDLGLEQVLLAAQAAIDVEQAARVGELKQSLNGATNARSVARALAKGVVKCFGWEYAGVFRVDRKKEEFELFKQYDRTDGNRLSVKTDYRQKLKDGMLGHCYREGKVLVVRRVVPRHPDETIPYDFIRMADSQSAMTVPLRLNGRIELVLDVESTQENAFAGPDKQAAEALAADCEQIFAGRWHEAIGHALMDAIEQAAVIVDPTGVIRQVNSAATSIVGDAVGISLAMLGATAEDSNILRDTKPREPTHVVLQLTGDVRVPTLATQRPLHDDYGHRMWLFTNLRERQWERDWRYLDETVSEVARQTRAPLLIADGLLRGAAGLLRKPGLAENCANLLDKAATQLLKADLTFERLSDSLTARLDPVDTASRFDALALLRQAIQTLPVDDIAAIDLQPLEAETTTFEIEGWPERLGFAFRSLLGYLLMSRGTRPIRAIAEITAAGALRIQFSAPSHRTTYPAPDAADPIAKGEERARQMVALSPDAIQSAIERHGGTFEMPKPDALDGTVVITLPPAPRPGL